jgi:hypothetical protein
MIVLFSIEVTRSKMSTFKIQAHIQQLRTLSFTYFNPPSPQFHQQGITESNHISYQKSNGKQHQPSKTALTIIHQEQIKLIP